jgi:hypothetical protein
MAKFRNWVSAAFVAALILLGPLIAFVAVVAAEISADVLTEAGTTAIWLVVAGSIASVLLRKFAAQSHGSRLSSEGA